MPLTIKLTDEEKSWHMDTTADLAKIMHAILTREIKVSVLPPLDLNEKDKYKRVNPYKTEEHKEGFYQIIDSVHELNPVITTSPSLLDAEVEFFWTIGLRADKRIAFIDLVSIGDDVGAKIGNNEALRGFAYYKAMYAVFVHNHPSGNLDFSFLDLQVTKTLIRAAWLRKVEVHDHLIINDKFEVSSLIDLDKMDDLVDSAMLNELDVREMEKVMEERAKATEAMAKEMVATAVAQTLAQSKEMIDNIVSQKDKQLEEQKNYYENKLNEQDRKMNDLMKRLSKLEK